MAVKTTIGPDGNERVKGFTTGDFVPLPRNRSMEDIGGAAARAASVAGSLTPETAALVRLPTPLRSVIGAEPTTRVVGGVKYRNISGPSSWF